ncbi:MAG: hypothetical protein JW797_20285 [Bradymonadales bacterium]|nr:hypothetical protein [Bradymonadales bacterium]
MLASRGDRVPSTWRQRNTSPGLAGDRNGLCKAGILLSEAATAPYGLGSTVGNAAVLLPDGSIRFFRANDWNHKTGGDWMNQAIIVYLP